MKKVTQLILVALMLMTIQACTDSDSNGNSSTAANKLMAKIDTSTPDGALMSVIASFKNNDIKALMQHSMSQEDYNKAVEEFEKAKKAPSAGDKAQFQQMIGMLTAEGAEDQLMAMATPQLEQMRAQLPMMLMMGKGLISSTIQSSTDIPSNQKETATKMANAVMDYVSENDILSEEVTRKAISAAVQTAKNLNMTSLDDLQKMSFDDAMAKGSVVMGGFKNVLGAYGISLDSLLDSVKVSDVKENGDNASMKVAYEFLGETFSQDVNMKKQNGKWIADK